jgi:uncharacterized membrane protein
MSRPMQPPIFFLNGAIALVLLFLVTLTQAPSAALNAVRALIGVGLVITVGKMILRYYHVNWPRRR